MKWNKLKESEKNMIKAFCFAVPIMWVLWYYLKIYNLFAFSRNDSTIRFAIYVGLVVLASGMWANTLNTGTAMKKLADK